MLSPTLQAYIDSLPGEVDGIPAERRALLDDLAAFVVGAVQARQPVDLLFICTHNSRRSHLGQVWAQVLAARLGIGGLRSYSGGTEATACNPRTVAALRAAGFTVSTTDTGPNPRYRLEDGAGTVLELWSKVFRDPANPQQGFAAIMTCDSANEACPIVPGAAARFPIMYEDPKAWDDTPEEDSAYATRCRQIAAELWYALSQVAA
ncbi:MAG: protein-tyrosine-phosphatase [Bacteroidia bacterium]